MTRSPFACRLLQALALLFAAVALRAEPSGAPFLRIDPSARSYSLGSAGAVAAQGAQALGQNPANLGVLSRPFEAFAAYESLQGGAHYQHAAFAMGGATLPRYIDAIAFSVTHLGVSGLPGADEQGNPTGSFSSGNMALAFGASTRLAGGLRLGAALKTVHSRIDSYSSNRAWAGDFGILYDMPFRDRGMSLALSVNNLGQSQKFLSQADPLPAAVQSSAAYRLAAPCLALAQARYFIHDQETEAGLGFEYLIGPASFRLGYSHMFGTAKNLAVADQPALQRTFSGFTTGVGLHLGSVQLDYAISQQAADYGPAQRVALTLAWGGRPGK